MSISTKTKKPYKNYLGGKNSPGVYQAIINCIPKHKTLLISFASNKVAAAAAPVKRKVSTPGVLEASSQDQDQTRTRQKPRENMSLQNSGMFFSLFPSTDHTNNFTR